MNKKSLLKFIAFASTFTFALGLTACTDGQNENKNNQPEHIHSFNKKVAEEKYIKSPPTCTQKAVYYFSCEL